jgi:pilus assembly protein CpaE
MLVLNQVGLPRRLEVGAKEIASVIRHKPTASIPFDARTFSQASSRGKMIADVARRSAVSKAIRSIVDLLAPTKQQVNARRRRAA